MTETQDHRLRVLKEMASGSIGMASASALLNPLDVSKVRMQILPGKYSTLLTTMSISYREAGGFVRGLLLPGLSATILRDTLNGAFRVGMYKEIERYLFPDSSNTPVVVKKVVTGCIVGSVGAGLWSHTDLVKTRTQIALPSMLSSPISIFQCYRSLVREEGFKSLYRGVGPNMLRASIITTCHVGTYDYSKNFFTKSLGVAESPALWTLCGFLSALVTSTASAPVDLVRNHVMTSPNPQTAFAIAGSIYRKNGLAGFFRGWFPSFYRFGPHFTISWPLIELARTRIFNLDSF